MKVILTQKQKCVKLCRYYQDFEVIGYLGVPLYRTATALFCLFSTQHINADVAIRRALTSFKSSLNWLTAESTLLYKLSL